jgi:cellulose synthase/poly-beta-1,6-N-acetylglucosamine synthase-like glycosyltransferase
MIEIIAFSLLALIYIYWGYGQILHFLDQLQLGKGDKLRMPIGIEYYPSLTVLVTVHNEVGRIQKRLDNIFQCEYPEDKSNVVVASDGSDDGTDDVVLAYGDSRVRLIRVERCGKTGAQNRAMEAIDSDIVVFTDADVEFDRHFLKKVVREFDDPRVGAATGHLLFVTNTSNDVSKSQGLYWNYELLLRRLESRLGILAVSSGSCLVLRRNLFCPMAEEFGDDCIVPLDIVRQGYKVVFAEGAYTYDEMQSEISSELRARTRMTLRNWQCTWNAPSLLNPFKHTGVAFSLWSHKILRWLSPFFVILLVLSSNLWALSGGEWLSLVLAGLTHVFIILVILGWFAQSKGKKIIGTSVAFSFMLANYGFLVGVLQALAGGKVRSYPSGK